MQRFINPWFKGNVRGQHSNKTPLLFSLKFKMFIVSMEYYYHYNLIIKVNESVNSTKYIYISIGSVDSLYPPYIYTQKNN